MVFIYLLAVTGSSTDDITPLGKAVGITLDKKLVAYFNAWKVSNDGRPICPGFFFLNSRYMISFLRPASRSRNSTPKDSTRGLFLSLYANRKVAEAISCDDSNVAVYKLMCLNSTNLMNKNHSFSYATRAFTR